MRRHKQSDAETQAKRCGDTSKAMWRPTAAVAGNHRQQKTTTGPIGSGRAWHASGGLAAGSLSTLHFLSNRFRIIYIFLFHLVEYQFIYVLYRRDTISSSSHVARTTNITYFDRTVAHPMAGRTPNATMAGNTIILAVSSTNASRERCVAD
jgi:hypothetical protein